MESLYPQLPALVVLFPFVGALIAALVGWSHRDRVYGFAVVILGLTVFSAVGCLCSVLHGNGMTYRLGGWPPPFGIEYKVDGMNALVLVVISASAFLTTLFSRDIVSDAVMTLCMFMAVAIIVHKRGRDTFDVLPGLYRKMPLTMGAFTVGALSLIGIPPTCGFFSKWYLLSAAIEVGAWHYMAALIFSSLVNAVLFFRIFEKAFIEPVHTYGGDHPEPEEDEAPGLMTVPLLVVAGSVILVGLLTGAIVTYVLGPVLPTEVSPW